MNIWSFTGNLGGDADQRHTAGGDSVVSFSVGVKSGFGEKASTTWAKCSMFGKRGESVLPYLLKGQLVGVSGEVNNREWQDKEGQKRMSLEVRVNDLTLLGSSSKGDKPQSKPAGKPDQSYAGHENDVPF